MTALLTEQLTDLVVITGRNFANVRLVRELAALGSNAMSFHKYQQGLQIPKVMDEWGIKREGSEVIDPVKLQELAMWFANQNVLTASSAADAAALVFAHSIVDNVATACCELIVKADPQSWRHEVDNNTITLADAIDKGPDALYAVAIAKYVRNIGKKSLRNRFDAINSRCQPIPPYIRDGITFKFDGEHLKQLDDLRHKIVHEVTFTEQVENIDAELAFLEDCCYYAVMAFSHRHRIPVDFQSWFERNVGGSPTNR